MSTQGQTPLERFTLLLGDDVFFIPCEWGTKKPTISYTKRKFEGTKTPAYRAVFDAEPTNIAVYLGKASGGLCAIDFDADEDLAAFLTANPKLTNTLRSRGSRGGMVWLRVRGDYPESCNRAQRFLILDGEPGRGKTQFANVMQELVGRPNVTQLRTKHLSERFELFRYLKKTLLVGGDVEAEFLSTKGAAVLKGLVGGDWFDAEQKGGTGSFPLHGTFNAIITSNARLHVRLQGDVGAWRRRLNIVRYEAPAPPKVIHDLGGYLVRTEGSVIKWAWALASAGWRG